MLAIELTTLCEALNVLPHAGGLLDQDYYHIRLLRAGLRAFSIKREIDAKNAGKG